MSSAAGKLDFNLGPSYGPIFIGALLETALWGMTTVQTVLYFINYGGSDRRYYKSVVLVNFILSTILVTAITSAVYQPLIQHFGNVANLRNFPWGIRAAGLLSTLIITHIHLFFLVRVYRFSKSVWTLVVATPFVLATFSMGMTADIQVLRDPSRAAADQKLGNINVANEALMSATDFILATMLTIYLLKREPKGTRKMATHHVVSGLIKYTIGTGALTGLLALIGIIVHFRANPGPSIGNAIYAAIPHTYSNAMLIILNTRHLVAKPLDPAHMGNDVSTLKFSEGNTTTGRVWQQSVLGSQTKIEHDLEHGSMSFAPPEVAEPNSKRMIKTMSSVDSDM